MKPIDYRNETWESIRGRLAGLRQDVYAAFELYGPCTTRELAERSDIDILTLRPRATELYQLGFLEVIPVDDPADHTGREAIYAAVPVEKARVTFEWLRNQPVQSELRLI
jgi:hypothetical protein